MNLGSTDKPVVMYDSDEAAHKETREVWVSRGGKVCDDEGIARYIGCTHRRCPKCGTVNSIRSYCKTCRDAEMAAKFDTMPRKEWDGKTPLVIFDDDRYFFDADALLDYCADQGVQPQDVRLCLCEPVHGRHVDDDFFCDDLPEDGDVPDAIAEAMEAFNAVVTAAGPLSWVQDKFAAIIPASYRVDLSPS